MDRKGGSGRGNDWNTRSTDDKVFGQVEAELGLGPNSVDGNIRRQSVGNPSTIMQAGALMVISSILRWCFITLNVFIVGWVVLAVVNVIWGGGANG